MTRRALWIAGAPARLVLIALVHLYRATAGQLLGGQCRFHPTCSEYALEAIRVHGAVKGSAMATWRVLRCSPLTAGGIDRVPARRSVYDSVIPEGRSGG